MTKNEIIEKVKELIAAPSCNAEVKSAAEAYLAKQDKTAADALIKVLETHVNSIDETIALANSDMGKNIFGAEQAANMVKLGNELKAKGEKYCFCPASQAGSKIYENKEALA
ncbi:MAG: heat-shock protein Hsp90 [Synergistaceae bacterium]|nr:heat-shock protein Hsp90 [Synergistaceae bacterium]